MPGNGFLGIFLSNVEVMGMSFVFLYTVLHEDNI